VLRRRQRLHAEEAPLRLGVALEGRRGYFEWFLRDAYGVKLLPAPAFTQGLVDRGIISLGMG
jgi:hypothetical protein